MPRNVLTAHRGSAIEQGTTGRREGGKRDSGGSRATRHAPTRHGRYPSDHLLEQSKTSRLPAFLFARPSTTSRRATWLLLAKTPSESWTGERAAGRRDRWS